MNVHRARPAKVHATKVWCIAGLDFSDEVFFLLRCHEHSKNTQEIILLKHISTLLKNIPTCTFYSVIIS